MGLISAEANEHENYKTLGKGQTKVPLLHPFDTGPDETQSNDTRLFAAAPQTYTLYCRYIERDAILPG